MSVISSTLDIARFLRERKGRKEEKEKYGMPFDEYEAMERLKIAKEQAGRERELWAPGREEKTGFTGVLPYTVKGQEPGLNVQLLKSQLSTGKKALAEPAWGEKQEILGKGRLAEIEAGKPDFDAWKKRQDIIQENLLAEIEARQTGKGAEKEAIPFDESGGFNTQIFANIAKGLFGDYMFRDVYDNIGLEEVRNKIRLEAVADFGQNDPAKVKQIESSLDEWLRILFQMIGTLPEEEKNQSFGQALSKMFGGLSALGGTSAITQSYSPYEGLPTGRDVTLPGAEQKELLSIGKGEKPKYRSGLFPGLMTGKKRKPSGIRIPGLQTVQ